MLVGGARVSNEQASVECATLNNIGAYSITSNDNNQPKPNRTSVVAHKVLTLLCSVTTVRHN